MNWRLDGLKNVFSISIPNEGLWFIKTLLIQIIHFYKFNRNAICFHSYV